MNVYLIWVQDTEGHVWCYDAWDESTRADDPDGWDSAMAEAVEGGGREVRIQRVNVPDVDSLFEIAKESMFHG